MKLGTKLLLAPLLTGLIALSGGAINAWLASQEASRNADAFHGNLEALRTLGQAKEQMGTLHAGVYRSLALMASLDEAAVAAFRKDLKNQVEGIVRVSAALGSQGGQASAQLDQVAQALTAYGKQADNAVDMASVDPNTGVAAMQSADASFQKASTAMAAIVTGMAQAADAAADESAQRAQRNTLALLAASLVATGITLALCALMLRRVMAAVRQARQVAEAVAQGDLAVAVHTDRPDEIAHRADRQQPAADRQPPWQQLTGTVQPERRRRPTAAPPTSWPAAPAGRGRRGGERGGSQVVSTMDEINTSSKPHRRHHRHHRRHRLPDQHPGAERRRGSRPRRRAGPRLCRGGQRSAQPGPAQRRAAREIKTLIGASVDKVEAARAWCRTPAAPWTRSWPACSA
jgi:hypothetical protein